MFSEIQKEIWENSGNLASNLIVGEPPLKTVVLAIQKGGAGLVLRGELCEAVCRPIVANSVVPTFHEMDGSSDMVKAPSRSNAVVHRLHLLSFNSDGEREPVRSFSVLDPSWRSENELNVVAKSSAFLDVSYSRGCYIQLQWSRLVFGQATTHEVRCTKNRSMNSTKEEVVVTQRYYEFSGDTLLWNVKNCLLSDTLNGWWGINIVH